MQSRRSCHKGFDALGPKRAAYLLSISSRKLDHDLAESIAALVAIGMMHQHDHDEKVLLEASGEFDGEYEPLPERLPS
jgi:hypothetical protein